MTLIKRDGIYYVEFYDASKNPKRKRYTLKTKNQRVALVRLKYLEEEYQIGRYDPWTQTPTQYNHLNREKLRSITWTTCIQEFLNSKIALQRSEDTIRTYTDVLNGICKRVDPEASPEAIGESVLMNFIYDGSVAQATQNKRYGHLRTYFRWLVEKRFIQINPLQLIVKPRITKWLPKAIDESGLDTIIALMEIDYAQKLSADLRG